MQRFKRTLRRRPSPPSPAMVVAVAAFVVACAGTAVAAVEITAPGQLKTGVVTGRAIRDKTITGADIKPASIDASRLAGAAATRSVAGGGALEVVNPAGPQAGRDQAVTLATLPNIPPGAYAIFAKTVLSRTNENTYLIQPNNVVNGECTLDSGGGGDLDRARGALSALNSQTAATLNMQLTRTYGDTGTVTLTCVAPAGWQAGLTSIIAVPVASVARAQVTG